MNVVPPLLSNEYLDGYRGRIGAFNGFNDRRQVRSFISLHDPSGMLQANTKRTFVESVAIVNSRCISDIVMEHTLWPLLSAIGRPTTQEGIESIARHQAATATFSRRARNGLWLCPSCIEVDLKTRYFTYWRRSHQMPGRHSCQEHGTRLRVVNAVSLMVDSPDEVLHRAKQIDESLFKEIQQSRLARRFEEFMDEVLEKKIVFEYSSCISKLKLAICPAGESIDPKLPLERFLRRLEKSLSVSWLDWLRPDISPGVGHLAPFFSAWTVTNSACFSINSLAIIANTIFPSADEAIHALRKG